MCELDQLSEMAPKAGAVSRRQFGKVGAVAGVGAALAPWATACAQGAGGLVETDVSFAAPGGTMDGFFVHPSEGKHPAVILWPDIAGIRDAKKVMARRLASSCTPTASFMNQRTHAAGSSVSRTSRTMSEVWRSRPSIAGANTFNSPTASRGDR